MIGNPFALIQEFSLLYDGMQMNGPGDGMLQNETVVEEELIDNQETDTPVGNYENIKPP